MTTINTARGFYFIFRKGFGWQVTLARAKPSLPAPSAVIFLEGSLVIILPTPHEAEKKTQSHTAPAK